MALQLVQLGLLAMTVIPLTSSKSIYDVIKRDNGVISSERSAQVPSRLASTVSKLTIAVGNLQKDVNELKAGSRQKDATGNLMD